jgi:hypothetical protein
LFLKLDLTPIPPSGLPVILSAPLRNEVRRPIRPRLPILLYCARAREVLLINIIITPIDKSLGAFVSRPSRIVRYSCNVCALAGNSGRRMSP